MKMMRKQANVLKLNDPNKKYAMHLRRYSEQVSSVKKALAMHIDLDELVTLSDSADEDENAFQEFTAKGQDPNSVNEIAERIRRQRAREKTHRNYIASETKKMTEFLQVVDGVGEELKVPRDMSGRLQTQLPKIEKCRSRSIAQKGLTGERKDMSIFSPMTRLNIHPVMFAEDRNL